MWNDDYIKFRIDQGAKNNNGSYNLVIQENGVPHGKTLASTTVYPGDKSEDVFGRLVVSTEANGHQTE